MKKELLLFLVLTALAPVYKASSSTYIPNCRDDSTEPLCFKDLEVFTAKVPKYFDRTTIFTYDEYGYVKCQNNTPIKRNILFPSQIIQVPTGKLRKDSEGNLIGGRSRKGPAREMKLVRADKYFDSLDRWEEYLSDRGLSINGVSKEQLKIAKKRGARQGKHVDKNNAICFLRWRDFLNEFYTVTDAEFRADILEEMNERDDSIFDSYFPSSSIEFESAIEMQNKSLSFLVDPESNQAVDVEEDVLNISDDDLNLTEKRALGQLRVDRDIIAQREFDSLNLYDSIQGPLGDTSPSLGRNSYDNGESWDVIFGNENIFAAEARIETSQYSDKGFDLLSINEMSADIYVFGRPLNLVSAYSSAFTDFDYKEVENSLVVAGRDVDQFNGLKNGESAKMINSNAVETVRKEVEISFSLGPIPVTATTGGRGTVSMSASSHAMKLNVMSSLTPSISVVGFAELAIDILVARAGVGGELRIIKDEVSSVSELGIRTRPRTGAIAYYSEMSAVNTLKTLNGRLYAFAEVTNPFGRNPRYEHNIFRWSGMTHTGALYSTSEYVDLFY